MFIDNINLERTNRLLEKVNFIEEQFEYLEQQQLFLSLGISGEFKSHTEIGITIEENVNNLNKIASEVTFLYRMRELGFPISLN